MGGPASRRGGEQTSAPSSDKPQETGSAAAQETLRLLAEELAIERRQVETGRVRVDVVTREHEEPVDVPLAREEVVVERVPIDRRVDAIPAIREDGDTIIVPVVEEVLVVERRLMLKEELHVKRVRTIEQYRENVKLRRQEAVVTRTPSARPQVDPPPAVGTKSRVE